MRGLLQGWGEWCGMGSSGEGRGRADSPGDLKCRCGWAGRDPQWGACNQGWARVSIPRLTSWGSTLAIPMSPSGVGWRVFKSAWAVPSLPVLHVPGWREPWG